MSKYEENKGFCMFYDWVEDLSYLAPADAWQIVRALNAYYTHIGVGYVASGHYWTQMFIGK